MHQQHLSLAIFSASQIQHSGACFKLDAPKCVEGLAPAKQKESLAHECKIMTSQGIYKGLTFSASRAEGG